MNEQMPGAVHEGADAAEDDLGASENEPLLHPDQGGQEGEPLGAPEDPAKPNGLTEDPSRLRGDRGEDEM